MKQQVILSTVIVLVLALTGVHAQSRSQSGLLFNGATYDVFIVKADSHSLSKLQLLSNTVGTTHADFVRQNIIAGDSDFFLINACVSGAACKPEGLFIEQGQEKQPLNIKDGTTNFYLKPNGALLLFANGSAALVESSAVDKYKNVTTGVQSGPMLLIAGAYHPQIRQGSSNKNIRCGVGMYTKGADAFLVFAISNQPVNFYDLAAFFKDYFKCDNALCLESSGCAMYAPFVERRNVTDGVVICNYILYKTNGLKQ